MSRVELLIARLKSVQSHTELYKSKSNNVEIEETKKIFNEIKNKIKKSKIKKIRKDLLKKRRDEKVRLKKRKNYTQKI